MSLISMETREQVVRIHYGCMIIAYFGFLHACLAYMRVYIWICWQLLLSSDHLICHHIAGNYWWSKFSYFPNKQLCGNIFMIALYLVYCVFQLINPFPVLIESKYLLIFALFSLAGGGLL